MDLIICEIIIEGTFFDVNWNLFEVIFSAKYYFLFLIK